MHFIRYLIIQCALAICLAPLSFMNFICLFGNPCSVMNKSYVGVRIFWVVLFLQIVMHLWNWGSCNFLLCDGFIKQVHWSCRWLFFLSLSVNWLSLLFFQLSWSILCFEIMLFTFTILWINSWRWVYGIIKKLFGWVLSCLERHPGLKPNSCEMMHLCRSFICQAKLLMQIRE